MAYTAKAHIEEDSAMRLSMLLIGLLASHCVHATTLTVGIEEANNYPFEFIDEQAELTGFHIEVVRSVCERLGWQLEFRRTPWKRTMRALESGEVQAATFVAKSAERERFARFLPHNLLHVSGTTLYIKRNRADEIQYQPPLEQMVARWRTGLPNGYYMSDEVLSLIERGAPIEQPTVTQAQLFIMLISDRFDAVFGSNSSLVRANTEIAGLTQQVQALPGAQFSGKPMYVAFSRAAPVEIAEQFAAAYRAFREEAGYRELAQRFMVSDLLPATDEFH